MKNYNIYTDGACSGNPGPGGWGAVIHDLDNKCISELMGGDHSTTNNRMEMMAAIKALDACESGSQITLNTDSQLLVKGANEWRKGWAAKGWVTSKKEAVANVDLWYDLARAESRHKSVKFVWVKGHASNEGNNRADALAVSACQQFK